MNELIKERVSELKRIFSAGSTMVSENEDKFIEVQYNGMYNMR